MDKVKQIWDAIRWQTKVVHAFGLLAFVVLLQTEYAFLAPILVLLMARDIWNDMRAAKK